jgi:DNA-binding ferritin-like protein (Dps family)
MKRLVERLQTKESEKSEMMNIFEERLKKMREDYKTACNKIRTGLNSTIDELKEKMAGQNLTIKALQSENFKFLDQDQEMIRLKYAHDVTIFFDNKLFRP